MNQEIKVRWVSALRSGEFVQTKEKLKDEEGYCCLGVLCELAVQDGVILPEIYEDQYGTEYLFGSEAEELPEAVADWAGLSGDDATNPHVNVTYNPPGVTVLAKRNAQLSELNDEMDWDFNAIADVIERDL